MSYDDVSLCPILLYPYNDPLVLMSYQMSSQMSRSFRNFSVCMSPLKVVSHCIDVLSDVSGDDVRNFRNVSPSTKVLWQLKVSELCFFKVPEFGQKKSVLVGSFFRKLCVTPPFDNDKISSDFNEFSM